jgi:hypothetical protein
MPGGGRCGALLAFIEERVGRFEERAFKFRDSAKYGYSRRQRSTEDHDRSRIGRWWESARSLAHRLVG